MMPGIHQRAAGKVDFVSSPGFAAGPWRSRPGVRRALRLGLVLFVIWGVASVPGLRFAAGQKNNPLPEEGTQAASIIIRNSSVHASPIQMNVDRVIVPVTVVDAEGQILTDLDKNDFEVFDDRVKQTILSFSTTDAPVAVAIIFDTSRSMSDKIQKSKEAALKFFKTSNPEDKFMLVAFSSRPYLVSAFTGDYEKLLDQVLFTKSDGETSLLDAIYVGLVRLKQPGASRKALLIISDGGDNHSRYTFSAIRRIVREANVQIYTIGIFEPPEYRSRTPEEAVGPSQLSKLATISGGRAFSVEDPNELPDITEEISNTLRNQYVIGYKPSNLVRDGGWRHIKIKVHTSHELSFRVYARAGYYAPTQ